METFADDPAAYFRRQSPHHLPLGEQAELQLGALQQRFETLKSVIMPLRVLADCSGVDEIKKIEDVAPVLFPHTIFKSFPQHLLAALDIEPLNEWITRLTTTDLSPVRGRGFSSADDWMAALDAETELWIAHSSGTTGAVSLFPRGKVEFVRQRDNFRTALPEWAGSAESIGDDPDFAILWPNYASGRSAALRGIDLLRSTMTQNKSMFFPLIPYTMSLDWQLFVQQVEIARRQGAPPPEPSLYVAARFEEAKEMQRTHADRVLRLLETIRGPLAGKKIVFAGGPISLFNIASEALKLGYERAFSPGSVVRSFGGLKGHPEPASMEKTILQFSGTDRIAEAYGMTEISTHFNICARGRFHVPPWLIPFVVNAETGEMKPRSGRQRGRAAFMDLLPQTYWGGVVTADLVEVSWDGCECDRTTPTIEPGVSRVEVPTGAHPRSPAGKEAIQSALAALNRGIV